MGPFRQSDAVLTVTQDNIRKVVEITAANDVASDITGYSSEELKGKPLKEIVSPRVAETIDDYVEFQSGANDISDVLRKVREFQLKNKDGKVLPFKLKILRHNSQEFDEFLLVLHDEESKRETDAFLSALRANFEGHSALNPDTQLPDRASFVKGMELAQLQLEKLRNEVSVAVIEIDAYDAILAKYGIQSCHLVMKHIAKLCGQNLRGNDVVAQLDKNRLALLLIGAAKDPAQMVLNRLRWLIAAQETRIPQGVDVQTTVSILFHMLEADNAASELIVKFEKAYEDKPADSLNFVAYI